MIPAIQHSKGILSAGSHAGTGADSTGSTCLQESLFYWYSIPPCNNAQTSVIHMHKIDLYIYTQKPIIFARTSPAYVHKRAMYECTGKPDMYAQKSPVFMHQRAMYIRTKEPCFYTKMSLIYMHKRALCIHTQKPSKFAQESPIYMHKTSQQIPCVGNNSCVSKTDWALNKQTHQKYNVCTCAKCVLYTIAIQQKCDLYIWELRLYMCKMCSVHVEDTFCVYQKLIKKMSCMHTRNVFYTYGKWVLYI